jgi:hypothetical protein
MLVGNLHYLASRSQCCHWIANFDFSLHHNYSLRITHVILLHDLNRKQRHVGCIAHHTQIRLFNDTGATIRAASLLSYL